MKTKLDEIGNVRNALAHFRPIKEGDLELIKQNANHALGVIEKNVTQIIRCSNLVPTNFDEPWFLELKTLGTEELKVKFEQSNDGNWVKLILIYHSSIIKKNSLSSSTKFRITKLKINNILKECTLFTNHLLLSREWVPYEPFNLEEPTIKKYLGFTFSKASLRENYKDLKAELQRSFDEISNEIQLVKNDDLARGAFLDVVNLRVEAANASVSYYEKSDLLLSPTSENDIPEFWGDIYGISDNFISDLEKFPWMPVKISDDKEGLPF